jgi:hypothetical protein
MARRSSSLKAQNEVKKQLGLLQFLNLAEAIFENAINAVGNVGQAFILVELQEGSLEPMAFILAGNRRQPPKSFFTNLFITVIGPEKYNAVKIIIEEMIEQLVEAWDDSTLQDSRNEIKLFLKTSPEDYMTNAPSATASMYAGRARMVMGI